MQRLWTWIAPSPLPWVSETLPEHPPPSRADPYLGFGRLMDTLDARLEQARQGQLGYLDVHESMSP
jgi:hypothetical protein